MNSGRWGGGGKEGRLSFEKDAKPFVPTERLMPSLECTMKPNSRTEESRAITGGLTEILLALIDWGDKTYREKVYLDLSSPSPHGGVFLLFERSSLIFPLPQRPLPITSRCERSYFPSPSIHNATISNAEGLSHFFFRRLLEALKFISSSEQSTLLQLIEKEEKARTSRSSGRVMGFSRFFFFFFFLNSACTMK